jgi:hypothetical protein
MLKSFFENIIYKYTSYFARFINLKSYEDKELILLAKNFMSTFEWNSKPNFNNSKWIQSKEFKVYSQFGDDGIIQWLIKNLDIKSRNFIEFGVGDFYESNSHFLLINNNWNGFVIDSSEKNISRIQNSEMHWKYNLFAKKAFIKKDNINSLLALSDFKDLGYLHIDLDGNDYWILDSLNLELYSPDILILEYNAIFGDKDKISIPYDSNFYRMNSHYSGKYWGASLQALNYLAEQKGYYFIGCNSAGNNAYFLNNKHMLNIPKTNIIVGFQEAKFKEARNEKGELSYLNNFEAKRQLEKLPVIDVVTNEKKIL